MALSAVAQESLRRDCFAHYLKEGIRDEEDLMQFVEVFFGYRIPAERVCPNHHPPRAFLADQFFSRSRTVIGFANRGGGKTILTAMLNALDAIFKPGIEIVCAGAVLEQTMRAYEYLQQFLLRDELFIAQVQTSIQKLTRLFNGSTIQIVTGTHWGLNGPHPNVFRCDEVELMHWGTLQEGLQMSLAKNGYPAQDTLTSTRKFQKGTMQRLLDEAPQKGMTIYSWCIWEVLERCERKCENDPRYGTCPLAKTWPGEKQPRCGGRAHHTNGWYSIDDFVKKAAVLDRDTWETQWENIRPSSGALVYGDYFRDEEPWVCDPFPIPPDWTIVSAIDFGSRFAYEKLAHDSVTDTWYVFHEYFFAGPGDRPLAALDTATVCHGDMIGRSPNFSKREWIFGDPAGRQGITDLTAYLRAKYHGPEVAAANNDVYAGTNLVKSLLQRRIDGRPGLIIFRNCSTLRAELSQTYVHRVGKDGKPNKDVVVKENDHCADALRYALYSYRTLAGFVRAGRVRGLY